MKGIVIAVMVFALLGFTGVSIASDWDIVGKVLTGIEGARILTGGKVDIIGSVMDIGGMGGQDRVITERRVVVFDKPASCDRTWVPDYTWREIWIPGHTEYDPRYGSIYIEGHYAKYRIENGGHWEYAYGHGNGHAYGRRGRR